MSSQEAFYDTLKKEYSSDEDEMQFPPFISYPQYQKKTKLEFVVYEDWWIRNPEIVLSKVKSRLGKSKRIFARKTVVKRIDKSTSDSFLEKNHIYGATKAKHKLGLFLDAQLVAVATFSSQRNLNVGRSSELIRFCSKNNTTIVGGLDKLLKHYIKVFLPNHIMTYIDKDWGDGKAFLKLGFRFHSTIDPIAYFVKPDTGERFRQANCKTELIRIYNRGSLKFELFVVESEVDIYT